MPKYKVVDIRLDGDQVGIVLEGKWKWKDQEMDDGFAVWLPLDEFKGFFDEEGNLDKDALLEFLKERVKERFAFLKQVHEERESRESAHKGLIEKVKEKLKDTEVSSS